MKICAIITEDIKHKMATKNQERLRKHHGHKYQYRAENDGEKLNFFGHISQMQDDRLNKQVVFGIIDGKNKRRKPKKKQIDDQVDWCNKNNSTLYRLAMDMDKVK